MFPLWMNLVLGEVRPEHHRRSGRAWRPGRLQVRLAARPSSLLDRCVLMPHEGRQV